MSNDKRPEFWLSNCGLFPLRAHENPHDASCVSGCDGLNIHVIDIESYRALEAENEDLRRHRKHHEAELVKSQTYAGELEKTRDFLKVAQAEAVKVIEFYADRDNWTKSTAQTCSTMIGPDDHDTLPNDKTFKAFNAGRIAREFLSKIKNGGAE